MVKSALDKLYVSAAFKSSPRQRRFLDYLVSHTLDNDAARLKGYTIAVEVFDRKEDFDPSLDAIVRVEATRLRNKLREYYASQGQSDEVVIEFPKGGYLMDFQFRSQTATAPHLLPLFSSHAQNANQLLPSLAVLPFTYVAGDTDKQYYADGITDHLLSMLSKLSGLFVISRQSSFVYRNSHKTASEIAQELGVRYLLEGTMQYLNHRVRVMAYLTDTTNGGYLWSDRYDRDVEDVFALQDDIAGHIVHALQIKLVDEEATRFGHEGTRHIMAHEALLRGMQQHWQYTLKSTREAQCYFEEALKHDAEYAAAHAWLARNLIYQWISLYQDETETIFDAAFHHATLAVTLAPLLSHAHAVLGWVYYWRKDAEKALSHIKRAVTMEPNNAEAYVFMAQACASTGDGKDGLRFIQRAILLNPKSSPWCHWVLGQCYWVLHDYDRALDAWLCSEQMSATFLPTQAYLCILYALKDDYQALNQQREKVDSLLAVNNTFIRSPWFNEEEESILQKYALQAGFRIAK